jgi:glutamate 5-kinase
MTSTLELRSEIQKLKRIVIKVGSNVITNSEGAIDEQIAFLAQDCKWLMQQNIEVILISSGAINLGKKYIQYQQQDIDVLQAASSVGQPLLFSHYAHALAKHDLKVAQILLTHEDFKDRRRFLNARNTLLRLLKSNIVPILNENDAVSFTEITVGDNDQLAAMTAQMLGADLLLLISSTDGLYSHDPSQPQAIHYPLIEFNQLPAELNTTTKTQAGRGGMKHKLLAVEKVTPLGIPVIIASKDYPHFIRRALSENVGTYFKPDKKYSHEERKAWLHTTVKNECAIEVDAGAAKALGNHSSLLPSGITEVQGHFNRGDCIAITYHKKIIALGLVEYTSEEFQKIKGKKSQDIQALLGFNISDVVIHKDNLVLKV